MISSNTGSFRIVMAMWRHLLAFRIMQRTNVELVEVIRGRLLADRNWDMTDDEFRFEGDVEGENDCYRYSGVNENV